MTEMIASSHVNSNNPSTRYASAVKSSIESLGPPVMMIDLKESEVIVLKECTTSSRKSEVEKQSDDSERVLSCALPKEGVSRRTESNRRRAAASSAKAGLFENKVSRAAMRGRAEAI